MLRAYKNAATSVLIAVLACQARAQGESPVIQLAGDQIVLANDVGCKLVISRQDGKYGLGTFYLHGVALGAPIERFLSEDNVGNNAADTAQRLWPGTWEPGFKATTYEILENTRDRGAIKFSGRDGNLQGSVTIRLQRGGAGYRLDFDMGAAHCIKHPLYVSAPFFPDQMEFVGFPFENPLIAGFRGRWTIQPTRSTVPLMFGREKIEGRDYYVGIGYRLDQNYQRGALEYDTGQPAPFKLRYVSPHASGWLGEPVPRRQAERYPLSLVISTAATQYDCITGYRLQSGYDISTPIRRGLDESIAGVMAMYKNSSAYVSLPPFKSKAYHQKINPVTGKPPDRGYGQYIPIGVNVQLAYHLYRYWQNHPAETWAKERAIEMANFFVETQNPRGAVPTLWEPQAKRFRAYNPGIDKAGYIYATCQQAMGAQSLYRLYLARQAAEQVKVEAWAGAARRAIDDLVNKIQPNGFLGRNYDEKGNYDGATAPDWPLIALDYFAAETGEAKYEAARARLEGWAYQTFFRTNHWYNWSSDGGNWNSPSAPPWNVDALNSLSLATYSALRHMRTGEAKYLEWAKDIISYNWLVAIPVQFPEFKHVTKALVREQDFYPSYDLPFRTCLYVDGFPYLSAVTGDRFFMDLYRLMIQTQMAYQNTPPRMQSFDIGLWWDPSGADPKDEVGELNDNYIVEFCSLFLESVTSPHAYRYVGGPDWGQGLDYELLSAPRFEKGGPYVISSSGRLSGTSWSSGTKTLRATVGGSGMLTLGWERGRYPAGPTRVLIGGKPAAPEQLRRASQGGRDVLSIGYRPARDTVSIEVSFP